MTYMTQSLSLSFWLSLETRLEQDFASGLDKLYFFRNQTVTADVDSADMARARVADAQADALQFMAYMEQLQSLLLTIRAQTQIASYEQGLKQLEARIRCLRAVADMYQSLGGQPRRLPAEDTLASLERRYAALRSAGGVSANEDRARVRDSQVVLPVLADEDVQPHMASARNLVTQIDNLEARAQAIRTTLMLQLQVPENFVPVLASFGVAVVPQEEAAGAVDPVALPAGTSEDAQ